jgi:hypothetical protein
MLIGFECINRCCNVITVFEHLKRKQITLHRVHYSAEQDFRNILATGELMEPLECVFLAVGNKIVLTV